MPRLAAAILFSTLLISAVPIAVGQSRHLIVVEDPVYRGIARLQRHGLLMRLNPTALPYDEWQVARALEELPGDASLSAGDAWMLALVRSRLSSAGIESRPVVVGFRLGPGLRATNNGRLDALRHLGGSDERVFQNAALQLRFAFGQFASSLGLRHDLYYDRDPDGLDTALRWLTRTENSYLRYDSRLFGIELGRFSRHWGLPERPASLVSDNPRSYDQFAFRVGGERLSVRAMIGELDSITGDGRFTGTAGDDSVASGSERRYLAVHRLDWRPSTSLQLYFFQATLYSGPGAGISLKYLNPFHSVIFALDALPKNEENNGFVGAGLWWRRGRTTVHIQGMIDDVDVLNFREPASFAAIGSVALAGVVRSVDLLLGGQAVAARAYNTNQIEGRYLYLLRGLATQFSDYMAFFAQGDIFLSSVIRGLVVSPRVDLLMQGQADIRSPFPGTSSRVPAILSGTVESTVRGALRLDYDPAPWFFLRLDAGLNVTSNDKHIAGRHSSRWIWLIEAGLRLKFDHAFSIDLQ